MASKEEAYQKIGLGHVSAMARQGLRELRGAIYPESNVAQQPEYGLYGTQTPGEVAASRRADAVDMSEEKTQDRDSVLGERMRQVESRDDRGDESRDMGRE